MPAARRLSKAVIPAAGLGTRFLPATKASPKEMLPVVDKPAIQYVVEEAVRAHLTDVLLVTGRGKRALEDHFDRAFELESALRAKGDDERLALVTEPTELANVHYIRQGEARGLGHAVGCAKAFVGDEPFAVLLGDDIIDPADGLLARMCDLHQRRGGSVLAVMRVPPEQVALYGCPAVEPTDEPDVVRITSLVEKPEPGEAPSDLAVIGRYILSPEIFDVLEKTEPGRGGEIQLTDAIRTLAERGPVWGLVFDGRRFDTGDKVDYIKAVVQLAVERPDIGPELIPWLREFVRNGLPE